jgi:F-type H+-transporting ATPase subunit b
MLDINASLFGIALLVGILLFVLNRLFYKPIGRVIEERESKIKNDSTLLETKKKDIEETTRDIEKQLKDAQKKARETIEESIKKGENSREQKLLEAREKAKFILDARMKQLDDELSQAEKKLELEISAFSDKIKEIFLS